MNHAFCRLPVLMVLVVGGAVAAPMAVAAEGPNGGGQHGGGGGGQNNGQRPTYQRRGFDWKDKGHDRRRENFKQPWITPQASSSWFQRPYPYHLDYYKMKYGGSYAPYFGNLYGTPFGTPAVVNGGWGFDGPGPGGWGAGPGVQPQGVEGSVWTPYALPPGAVMEQQGQAVESNVQTGAVQEKSESLPAPTK